MGNTNSKITQEMLLILLLAFAFAVPVAHDLTLNQLLQIDGLTSSLLPAITNTGTKDFHVSLSQTPVTPLTVTFAISEGFYLSVCTLTFRSTLPLKLTIFTYSKYTSGTNASFSLTASACDYEPVSYTGAASYHASNAMAYVWGDPHFKTFGMTELGKNRGKHVDFHGHGNNYFFRSHDLEFKPSLKGKM